MPRFLINLGPRGVEAFDQDEEPLGVFPSGSAALDRGQETVALGAAALSWLSIAADWLSSRFPTGPPLFGGMIDIPIVGTGAKERVDVAALRNFIDRHDHPRG